MNRVLIVDDMQQNLELMSSYLKNSGLEVYTASSGASALKKARILKPFLIILDLIMPEISGYDVCKTLKGDPQTDDILILIVTALDSKESRKRAFALGADDFLPKPFDKGTFLSKLKGLFRLKNLNDELEKQYSQLKEKNMQLELQMKMARQIQQAMIEEYKLTVNHISITSRYMPAFDVGGDLYDVIKPNDQSVCIFIADVSGHGVSAALLTAMLKLMFKNTVETTPKPDFLLKSMNEQFCSVFSKNKSGVYACAFYAYIDTKEKRITYSNAGHALPIFVDASENSAYEIAIGGIPLGLMDDSTYECQSITYEDGDFVLFLTDGLGDSFYKDSPEDFVRMLKELLLGMVEGYEPDEILDEVIEHFYDQDEETKYENDDVSLILCHMTTAEDCIQIEEKEENKKTQ